MNLNHHNDRRPNRRWLPTESRTSLRFRCILVALCLVNLTASSARAQSAERLFAQRVLPLFKEKCFTCHGNDKDDIRGELNMQSRAGLVHGGESGEASLILESPMRSPLYLAITRESDEWSPMPPKENDRLTQQQVSDIEQWLAGGAPWPTDQRIQELLLQVSDDKETTDVQVTTSGGLSDDWTHRKYKAKNLWAYQPVRPWEEGKSVDDFVAQRLLDLEILPASRATRQTLIRRATFDLIGLPPTRSEIKSFVEDPASDEQAFATLVNRLLDSPHYGEQWARHWLDVVRYADSSGYANDYERGNTWRYRDYVVRAFNDDKPYDQFIREQIAGDEIDATNPELLVAAGFLRMGPWELTGMEVAKVARQRFLDDVTDAVGQVFLGHMLQCARCHDHKFDPVPTRDYYSLQAAFATTQLAERSADFLPQENTDGFEEKKYAEQRLKFNQDALAMLAEKHTITACREWLQANGRDPEPFEKTLEALTKTNPQVSVAEIRTRMQKQNVDPSLIPPKLVGFLPEDYGLERIARKGIERLQWVMDRYEPVAFSVYSGPTPQLNKMSAPRRQVDAKDEPSELEQTCILTGGDPFSPSAPVEPSVLSATQMEATIPNSIEGRRLAVAEWIASANNPLTARVMVNRIWQWHLGKPIAGNPNNYGATGKKPTHPELLDWLAATFVRDGWSVKAMHRVIMNSDVYCRSTKHVTPDDVLKKDPNQESLATFLPRRLEAEEIRDAMLLVSGELNPRVGGIPIRPEINLEAAFQPRMVMGTFAEAWQPSPLPSQRHRRTLYALRIRGLRNPFMEVFNSPAPEISCEARDASTVTPQVFAMFNSEIAFDRALAMARRAYDKTSEVATIREAFELAYGREPRPTEATTCLEHWKRMTRRHEQLHFDQPTYHRHVVRVAAEENTGEKFTFTEPLEVYEDFVPDLKPADASPNLRGLAEVCLVLLNSNEFVYVY